MSLGSRFASLFSGSTDTKQDRHQLDFVDDGLSVGKQTFADVSLGIQGLGSDTMASQADEEEGRPPYLHVRVFISSYWNVPNLYRL